MVLAMQARCRERPACVACTPHSFISWARKLLQRDRRDCPRLNLARIQELTMMKRMMGRTALLVAAFAGLTAMADDEPKPVAPPGTPVGEVARPLRAKQVLGARISIQNNTAVGTVDDIVLSDAGDVEYVVVQTDENKMVTVPWSTVVWNKDYKSATINVTVDQFKVIPRYSNTAYPDYFAPTYRTEIYKQYGVAPGTLRRIERRINR